MKSKELKKYVAFLRGINVGGHHKVPMAELRNELINLGFKNVLTSLNSGNVIFDTTPDKTENLEKTISLNLEETFDFPVPTMVREAETIREFFSNNPFQSLKITANTRLYVSFVRENNNPNLKLPWISADHSFKIINRWENVITSVLDLSISKTPKAMEALEKFFGKDITTRNWKTIERIVGKL